MVKLGQVFTFYYFAHIIIFQRSDNSSRYVQWAMTIIRISLIINRTKACSVLIYAILAHIIEGVHLFEYFICSRMILISRSLAVFVCCFQSSMRQGLVDFFFASHFYLSKLIAL